MTLQRLFIGVFLVGTVTMSAQNISQIAPGQRGYSPQAQAPQVGEPEAPDINLLIIERADMYEQLLGIDVFTKEVLKSYLKEYYTETSSIAFNTGLKFEQKRELINMERKKLEKSLGEVFTVEQVEQILTEEEFGQGEKKLDKETRKEKRKKRKDKSKG